MSWIEYTIHPISEKSKNFLQTYSQNVLEASKKITEYRLDKYEQQESIFEIDLDFIGTNRSELFIPDLPYTHIRQLVDINADLWKKELYRCLENGQKDIHRPNISAEKTKELLPHGLLYWSDYSITDNKLSIKANNGEIYRFEIETDSSIIGSVPKHSIAKLYPDDNKISIKTSKSEAKPRAIETSGDIRPEKFTDSECLLKILSVYNTDQPATQIDIPKNTDIDYVQLFNMLGLHWKKPEENTYMITTSLEYLDKIDEFISLVPKDRTIQDYYEIFGYPETCGKRLDSLKGCFDAISGEEFVLYGLQNGVISKELTEYVRYIPYQPQPNLSSVHTALVSTRDRLNIITESASALEHIKGHSTQDLLNNYKQNRSDYQWKTLDVPNYLAETN